MTESNLPWKIHKRLLDAGGLGDTVYILPARGNGKIEAQRQLVEDLLKKGKDVVLLPLEDLRNARTKPAPVPDFDLLLEEDRLSRANGIVKAIQDAIDVLKKKERPMYLPEYEMLKDFYVLDKTKEATPYLHWIKSNPYCTTMYSKNEEEDE